MMGWQYNTIILRYCTDPLGYPFLKVYYGVGNTIVSGKNLTIDDSAISDFAYTFTQSIVTCDLLSKMYFKNLANNTAAQGTIQSIDSVLAGTVSLTPEEYERIYLYLRGVAQKLHIHFIHMQEPEDVVFYASAEDSQKENDIILEEFGGCLGFIQIDQSKGVTTQKQYQQLTKDYNS